MDDTSETLPKRRRATRKGAKKDAAAKVATDQAAVQAILEQALHPDPAFSELEPEADVDVVAEVAQAGGPGRKSNRRSPRKRTPSAKATATAADVITHGAVAAERAAESTAQSALEAATGPAFEAFSGMVVGWEDVQQTGSMAGATENPGERIADDPHPGGDDQVPAEDPFADSTEASQHGAPPAGGHGSAQTLAHDRGHHWVYLAFILFVLALGFGAWGVWTTFFASADPAGQSVSLLRARSDNLSQQVATLRRSDQISREANRDLERTLAERDEEIAGLRADIAFYEGFVGATGQRRGLSVHDLDLQLHGNDAWHFVATLTQNLNRGAVNSGRLTIAVEGTRNDRLERLSWSSLRKLNNAPGVEYSFKYFQQVEGELMLPPGFKPLRINVRLVPAGGKAVEQSFSWPDTVKANR